MENRYTRSMVFAVSAALAFKEANAVDYNGNIQYFIADFGPTSPCHPLFERSFTWVDTGEEEVIDRVLSSIVYAGFNGIRFPMWPEGVAGPDPSNTLSDINKEFCDDQTKIWIKRIKSALEDSVYKDLFIYMSPGLDNKTFQGDLTNE